MKNIWRGIKQIISIKPRVGGGIPSQIIEEGSVLSDSTSIAQSFNNFFANVGNNLAVSVPYEGGSPISYMPPRQLNSIFLYAITSEEIEIEINKLNSSKATGPFSVPVNILKLIMGIICKPLDILFNSSLLTGCVLDCFKMARVIPIQKSSTMHCNKYRPISLLSIFNKLLEKLVFNRISCFIEKHNILYNKQFGFRAKHSTLHAAILSITDQIQTAVENGYYSCGIFLDLSKALIQLIILFCYKNVSIMDLGV